jgi:hypothetical protein
VFKKFVFILIFFNSLLGGIRSHMSLTLFSSFTGLHVYQMLTYGDGMDLGIYIFWNGIFLKRKMLQHDFFFFKFVSVSGCYNDTSGLTNCSLSVFFG